MRSFYKKEIPYYWDFFDKYFIQPFIILEDSCKFDSSSMYVFLEIISNSYAILINLFMVSVFILIEFNIGGLLIFNSREAFIRKSKIFKQIFSIFNQIPKRSFLGILEDNKYIFL
ncbi:MAG: hypothetical protein ABIH51_01435 [Patescibacteria group bacterium]